MREIVSVKIHIEDRDFLERIKRKTKSKSLTETFNKIIKLFKRNKLHLDIN